MGLRDVPFRVELMMLLAIIERDQSIGDGTCSETAKGCAFHLVTFCWTPFLVKWKGFYCPKRFHFVTLIPAR